MKAHTIKYEYWDGKKLTIPILWCGRISSSNQGFLDAQHLALSVNGSKSPCKKCIRAIINELSKEL